MSLFRDARPQIVASINTLNNISLKMSDLLWSPAQRVSEITPAPTTTKNSGVVLRAAPNAPYTSSVRVFYDRLSFATVFANTPVNTYAKLRSYSPATTHDLIPALNDYYGLELTVDDIELINLNLTNGSGVATIRAKSGSFTWMDEFTVTVAPGDLTLDTAMTVTSLDGVQYPSGQSTKGQAEVYSYRYDCSAYGDFLKAITITDPVDVTAAVCDFISAVTGDVWTLTPAGNFSLLGAKIVYNGANSLSKPSNSNYDYLFEIQLSDSCANFAGTLRFHYNVDVSIDTVATTATDLSFTVDGLSALDPANSSDTAYNFNNRYSPYIETAYNDYSAQAAVLKTLPWQSTWTGATDANATSLAAALKAVDGRPWVMNSTVPLTEFNLYAAWIRYNGPISGAPLSGANLPNVADFEYRSGFTNVLIFCPPYQQQTNLWYGTGFVYYNV